MSTPITTIPLQGSVAIVTGGGTGIGRGISLGLARQGVKVVLCGRRKEPLGEVAQAIWRLGDGAPADNSQFSLKIPS